MNAAAVTAAFCVGAVAATPALTAVSKTDGMAMLQPAGPRIVVHLSPIANFAYQLDCISGWLRSCGGRDEYRELWRERFGVDADRSPDVAAWGSAFSGGHDLLVRARIASFEARSIDDYARRIAVLFPPTVARRVRTIAAARYPGFLRWWQGSNVVARERRVEAFRGALHTAPIIDELPRLYGFFAVPDTATRTLDLALLYRPTMGDLPYTTGEFLGDDWSVAEFGANEDLANRLAVVLHEYTHYVYSKMPGDERRALGRAIVGGDASHGDADWSLFNEAIATAVGNGRVYRSLATPDAWKAMLTRDRSFYSDPPVDAAAKAILPLVDATLDRGGSVTDPAFAKGYDSALDARLGRLWGAPSLVLGEFRAVADDQFDKSVLMYAIRTFRAHSVYYDVKPCCGEAFMQWWEQRPAMTRLAVLDRTDAAKSSLLDETSMAALNALPAGKSAYSIRRNGAFLDIVVVADSADAAKVAIDAIARSDALDPGFFPVASENPAARYGGEVMH